MNDAFKQGYISYSKNNGIYDNPYQSGTDDSNEFERGWTQAMKRLPERDFSSGKYIPRTRQLDMEAEKTSRIKNKKIDKALSVKIKSMD